MSEAAAAEAAPADVTNNPCTVAVLLTTARAAAVPAVTLPQESLTSLLQLRLCENNPQLIA